MLIVLFGNNNIDLYLRLENFRIDADNDRAKFENLLVGNIYQLLS